jgi:hypothetical protein
MNYPTGKVDYYTSNVSVAEGKRMAMMTCGPCHFNPSTNDFSGKQMNDVPGIVGKIYASNITKDLEAGIGEYTHLCWKISDGNDHGTALSFERN